MIVRERERKEEEGKWWVYAYMVLFVKEIKILQLLNTQHEKNKRDVNMIEKKKKHTWSLAIISTFEPERRQPTQL